MLNVSFVPFFEISFDRLCSDECNWQGCAKFVGVAEVEWLFIPLTWSLRPRSPSVVTYTCGIKIRVEIAPPLLLASFASDLSRSSPESCTVSVMVGTKGGLLCLLHLGGVSLLEGALDA